MEEVKVNQASPERAGPSWDRGVQTDSRGQGPAPRLSRGNLFSLLSLWMELFPQEQTEERGPRGVQVVGLVVVADGRVVGLHSSGSDLHAAQAAILDHGAKLKHMSLYFSRRPCATCIKMVINAGVSEICFWPGDPEVSMLSSKDYTSHDASLQLTEEAALDALAVDQLKSNSGTQIWVPLKPLPPGLVQFVTETSRDSDFMQKMEEEGEEVDQLFNRQQSQALSLLTSRFLVSPSQHQKILSLMKLENFCVEPYFSGLRHNMEHLLHLLSAVVASVPALCNYGFYRSSGGSGSTAVSLEVALHCMIQARLLSYRTEDPKVGVGAVIWVKRQQGGGPSLMGGLSLVGSGFNAYPSGSQYQQYPQHDDKQEDRERRKYRFMIHAEQNAITFRSRAWQAPDASLLFVTKCPCDECVPLIRAAGVSHIYCSDCDQDRDKGDISYRMFRPLQGIHKYCWQKSPVSQSSSPHNGFLGKHRRQMDPRDVKKLRIEKDPGEQRA
ncbi:unnamed protein product [Knipowitschia caucasica]|uniref:Cytidine and dCMP deaminase domain-containing protein 1 n=1 Tax=Knipowitschia caucasica TaxID=637954 RepID=A0AAV2LBZ9_KNICA